MSDEQYHAILSGEPMWDEKLRDPKPVRGSRKRAKCPKGHAYTRKNTYINPRGAQECMECRRAKNREYKERLRERGLKPNRGRIKSATPRIVTCPDCGGTRTLLHSPKTGRCKRCARIHKQGGLRGRNVTCPCGREFYVTRIGARFCSMGCKSKYWNPEAAAQYSVERRGEGNPNFRHGRRTDVHLSGWSVRRKGEKCCRNCGSRERLHLHHVIPRSKYRSGRAELLNGIALCFDCHTGWHGKRLTLYRDLFTAEEWAWLMSAQLTGELIEPWLDRHYPVRPQEVAA